MKNVLFIDKPKGMTSFDVCYKLRKVLGTKKIGHTGTLDPNATGVMIVLFDKATKANQFLVSSEKEYIACVKLGVMTDTLDIDGNVIEERVCKMPDALALKKALNNYLGISKQTPPLTSAIKVAGKKLYEYQRENLEVKIPEREIEVKEIELLSVYEDEFVFRCKVSSGTYIRSLVRDILNDLGLIGTLKDLMRTKIDNVDISKCDKFEDVLNDNYHAYSLYEVMKDSYYLYEVSNKQDVLNGKPLKLPLKEEEILCVSNKEVLAIYRKEKGIYRCVRGLW